MTVATAFVEIRDPLPPYQVVATPGASEITWGDRIMQPNTAAFKVSRADPIFPAFASALDTGAAVTIRRSDGLFPFFGWLTSVEAADDDGLIDCVATDNTWLLQGARTTRDAPRQQASGELIAAVIREADARAAPPLNLNLSNVLSGPAVEHALSFEQLDDFLTKMSEKTGWEWALRTSIDGRGAVSNLLEWRYRRGSDRRAELVLQEGRHLQRIKVTKRARGFRFSTFVIGGTGDMLSRPVAEANLRGSAPDVDAVSGVTVPVAVRPTRSPALNLTRVVFARETTDIATLQQAAQAGHDDPRYTAIQISTSLVESEVDMRLIEVGSVYSVNIYAANLGVPERLTARLMAIKLNPDTGVHDIELQVRGEM